MGEYLIGTNWYHGTQPGGYKNLVALKFCWTCFLFLMLSPFCAIRFWGNLGGGFKHLLFSPLLGEDPQFWPIFFRWVESTNQKCTPKTDVGSQYSNSAEKNWKFPQLYKASCLQFSSFLELMEITTKVWEEAEKSKPCFFFQQKSRCCR